MFESIFSLIESLIFFLNRQTYWCNIPQSVLRSGLLSLTNLCHLFYFSILWQFFRFLVSYKTSSWGICFLYCGIYKLHTKKLYCTRAVTCNFTKTRLQHRCFPVKFAKFLRTSFLHSTSGWLLLKNLYSSVF